MESLGDPHPLCEPCMVDEGFPLCDPTAACEFCADLPADIWRRIMDSRRKRQLRAERLSTIASTSSAQPVSDTEQDLEIVGYLSPPHLDPEASDSQVDLSGALDILQTQTHDIVQQQVTPYDAIFSVRIVRPRGGSDTITSILPIGYACPRVCD